MFDWIDLFLFSTNALFGSFMFSMFIIYNVESCMEYFPTVLGLWAYHFIFLNIKSKRSKTSSRVGLEF